MKSMHLVLSNFAIFAIACSSGSTSTGSGSSSSGSSGALDDGGSNAASGGSTSGSTGSGATPNPNLPQLKNLSYAVLPGGTQVTFSISGGESTSRKIESLESIAVSFAKSPNPVTFSTKCAASPWQVRSFEVSGVIRLSLSEYSSFTNLVYPCGGTNVTETGSRVSPGGQVHLTVGVLLDDATPLKLEADGDPR